MFKLKSIDQIRRSRSRLRVRRASIRPDTAREVNRSITDRAHLDNLINQLSSGLPAADLRLRILRQLDRSESTSRSELARAWPITRAHIRAAARSLEHDGLVEFSGEDGRSGRLRLSQAGRRVLDEIDWKQAVASLERGGRPELSTARGQA